MLLCLSQLTISAGAGELRSDILYAGSDQSGRSSSTINVERCITAIVLAVWYVSSCRWLCRWSIPDWTATTRVLFSLHGWTRGCTLPWSVSFNAIDCTLTEAEDFLVHRHVCLFVPLFVCLLLLAGIQPTLDPSTETLCRSNAQCYAWRVRWRKAKCEWTACWVFL